MEWRFSVWLKRLWWFAVALVLSCSIHYLHSGAILGQYGAFNEPHAQATIIPPQIQVQQGRDAYQAGQYHDAIQHLQQAISTYQAQQAPLNQALALSYLALAYQEMGDRSQAETAIQTSLALIPADATTDSASQVQAQVWSTHGELLLAWGQIEAAVNRWQQAFRAYQKLNDQTGQLGVQINQIQALRALGHYRQTQRRTDQLAQDLATLPDSTMALVGWRSLGNTQYAMGDYSNAQIALEQSLAIAQRLHSPQDMAAAWLSLGNLKRAEGDRQRNQKLLASYQSLVQQSVCPSDKGRAFNIPEYQAAADYYQQAIAQDPSVANQVRSRLNQLDLALILGEQPSVQSLKNLDERLGQLPSSRFAIDAQIRFALDVSCLSSSDSSQARTIKHGDTRYDVHRAFTILDTAIENSQSLGDRRAESKARGTLGALYETHPDALANDGMNRGINSAMPAASAQTQTETALSLAQRIQAPDLAYRWQWQMGRLLRDTGDRNAALTHYTLAFNTLQTLRADLTVLNTDLQFAFREQIEPLYRQFADLLLRTPAEDPSQTELKQARQVLEALQLAELDNFFQDACSTIPSESLDTIIDSQNTGNPDANTSNTNTSNTNTSNTNTSNTNTSNTNTSNTSGQQQRSAVLYSIILPDRIDIILKVPRASTQEPSSPHESANEEPKTLWYYSTPIPSQEVRNTVLDFRRKVTQPVGQRIQAPAKKLYEWLIYPAEAQLKEQGINHLVFVLDGVLRNVAITALYDGDRYVVDRYAMSLAPGLQLLGTPPQTDTSTRMLAAGLSESRSGFPPLENVEVELEAIAATLPDTTKLLNQEFTEHNIESTLKQQPVSIVHMATHGQFSSQAENTFILTHDGNITVNELDILLRGEGSREQAQPVDLLVLSACQTASGDERAALGLAGVAVRAGARSTLASLWTVDDRATALLVTNFYRYWHNSGEGMTKVQALRLAQQSVRDYQSEGTQIFKHPRYWSAFVLLGDWSR